MGTNYYHHPSGERECPHFHQETPNQHIGKSSFGWAFSLHVYPHDGIVELADWVAKWKEGGKIFDENHEEISIEEMIATITDREHPEGLRYHTPSEWGLDAKRGLGTYDLCNYEFS